MANVQGWLIAHIRSGAYLCLAGIHFCVAGRPFPCILYRMTQARAEGLRVT